MSNKITIIGSGHVGTAAAQYCLAKRLGDIVMVDVQEGQVKGKALDLAQAAALDSHGSSIIGTSDYAETADSSVVVVTAGIARKPGMTRDDLERTNASIVADTVAKAMKVSPNAMYIVATNPVDTMCMVALRAGGMAVKRIVGLSGVLDSARMCAEIAAIARVNVTNVYGLTIGEHGSTMVPLTRLARIGGVPVPLLLSQEEQELVKSRTVNGGARIIELMGMSASFGPGSAISFMVQACMSSVPFLLPCSVYLTGQYGVQNFFLGAPVRLSEQGVQEVVELELNNQERQDMAKSVAAVGEKARQLDLK
ncbi:MAG: malate dehydrogenase [Desulfovibrio sp.]|nr:malate dehydrogenase [Desulfovibrio sp.]